MLQKIAIKLRLKKLKYKHIFKSLVNEYAIFN